MRVALFANGNVGVEVARHLIASGDQIVKLYLHDKPEQQCADEILKQSRYELRDVIYARESQSEEAISALAAAQVDFIITVYWSYILKPELLRLARVSTVNFHPALLPINRGWYPHVHSFLDGTPFGVTLHQLAPTADTGDIWAQREVFAAADDTAGSMYAKLQEEIASLFVQKWSDIKAGRILPVPQDERYAIYHKRKEVDSFDCCDIDNMSGKELMQRLKARTFGEKAFAYFLDPHGNRVYMHLKLIRK